MSALLRLLERTCLTAPEPDLEPGEGQALQSIFEALSTRDEVVVDGSSCDGCFLDDCGGAA